MQALVLEEKGRLALRDITVDETLGPRDVRVKIHTVGICGSDIHYYTHGRIGPFVVKAPMILGHEASGTVLEVGSQVTHLKAGDRVCMEPGIPDPNHRATRLGMYNIEPNQRFWATPPVHGALRPNLVHPGDFTFKLPENVSFAEGAMVEPLAVGMQAAWKAKIKPGDIAVVTGAGPIGIVTALAALAGGCARVYISDVQQPKLDIAKKLGPIVPVNVAKENLADVVMKATDGWGADVLFECSGNETAAAGIFDVLCPGGTAVMVGIPMEPVAWNVIDQQVKEITVTSILRYAHQYPRTLTLLSSGKIDVKPLITKKYAFKDSVEAFEFATHMPAEHVKVQIELPQ